MYDYIKNYMKQNAAQFIEEIYVKYIIGIYIA